MARINALEPAMKALSDEELRGKTALFRARIAAEMEKVADADEKEQKEARAATLDDILEEAFAVVREASVRALGMRPFDVQLIGGMVLHQGKISEMKTGEGKTLVATMPVYLNALPGRGSRPEMCDLFYDTNMKGWGPELIKRRPEITMEMVEKFLTNAFTDARRPRMIPGDPARARERVRGAALADVDVVEAYRTVTPGDAADRVRQDIAAFDGGRHRLDGGAEGVAHAADSVVRKPSSSASSITVLVRSNDGSCER